MHLTLDRPPEGLFRNTTLGPSPLSDSVRLDGTQELASPTSSQALPVQGPYVASGQSSGCGRDGAQNIGRKEQKARAVGSSTHVELDVTEDRTGGLVQGENNPDAESTDRGAWPGEQWRFAIRRRPERGGG